MTPTLYRKKFIMLKKTLFALLAIIGVTAVAGLVAEKFDLLDR